MPALNELDYRLETRTVHTIRIDLGDVAGLNDVSTSDDIEVQFITANGPTTARKLSYHEKRLLLG